MEAVKAAKVGNDYEAGSGSQASKIFHTRSRIFFLLRNSKGRRG